MPRGRGRFASSSSSSSSVPSPPPSSAASSSPTSRRTHPHRFPHPPLEPFSVEMSSSQQQQQQQQQQQGQQQQPDSDIMARLVEPPRRSHPQLSSASDDLLASLKEGEHASHNDEVMQEEEEDDDQGDEEENDRNVDSSNNNNSNNINNNNEEDDDDDDDDAAMERMFVELAGSGDTTTTATTAAAVVATAAQGFPLLLHSRGPPRGDRNAATVNHSMGEESGMQRELRSSGGEGGSNTNNNNHHHHSQQPQGSNKRDRTMIDDEQEDDDPLASSGSRGGGGRRNRAKMMMTRMNERGVSGSGVGGGGTSNDLGGLFLPVEGPIAIPLSMSNRDTHHLHHDTHHDELPVSSARSFSAAVSALSHENELTEGSSGISNGTPTSGTKGRRQKSGNLPRPVVLKLKAWLFDHLHHPYPSEIEKSELRGQLGINANQLNTWFINARRRFIRPVGSMNQVPDEMIGSVKYFEVVPKSPSRKRTSDASISSSLAENSPTVATKSPVHLTNLLADTPANEQYAHKEWYGRQRLNAYIMPIVHEGIKEIEQKRAVDPCRHLGLFLLEHSATHSLEPLYSENTHVNMNLDPSQLMNSSDTIFTIGDNAISILKAPPSSSSLTASAASSADASSTS